MNNQNTNNEFTSKDSAVQNTEEIKGGPTHQSKRDLILRSTVAAEQDDDTLRGFTLNHNETVSEDSEADTQKLTDLTIEDETESAVKGGLLLPAVQKVREAAAVTPTGHSGGGAGAGKVIFQDIH